MSSLRERLLLQALGGSDAARLGLSEGARPKASQIGLIDAFWCIDDDFANAALAQLNGFTIIESADFMAMFEARESGRESDRKPYEMRGSTAVIPISGPMTKEMTSAAWLFGGTSTQAICAALKTAGEDKSVKSVLLRIDSPGGQVDGTADLGDAVREFGKPITAYIEDMGASAAYWVASQANSIYTNRTAKTGSIGVRTVVYDSSTMAGLKGIKVHSIASGSLKGAGEPGTQITSDHLKYFQSLIDGLFEEFKSAVQTGRSMSDEQFAKVSDGRMILASDALALGLIDGVCSLDECLKTLSEGSSSASTTSPRAHDSGPSVNASGQGTHMNLKDLVSRVRGIDPETLKKADIDPQALDGLDVPENATPTPAVTNATPATPAGMPVPAIEAAIPAQDLAILTSMKNANVAQAADAFWNELITPDANGRALATWTQEAGVKATFIALASADGGPKFDGAFKLVETPALKTYKDSMKASAPNILQGQQIKNQDPRATSAGAVRPDVVRKAVAGRFGKAIANKVVGAITGGDA